MKTRLKLGLAVLAGLLIGAGGSAVVHSQQTKTGPGYLVAEVDATDPAGMADYASKVPATLESFNHHYVVLGGNVQTLEGDPPKGRVIIIGFDSAEKAREWYDSPAYAAIRPIRQKSSHSRVYIVEGVPAQ